MIQIQSDLNNDNSNIYVYYQAVIWLRKNKDEENFMGAVHEPFVLCGNVPNESNQIFLRDVIAEEDMTIFFFEDADDMNKYDLFRFTF